MTRIVGDRYGGEWPREVFRKAGIAYEPAAAPKSDLYLACLPVINSGRAALLDVPRLAAQLVSLERRTGRGKDVIDHGPGGHDDVINAAAGALVLAARPVCTILDDVHLCGPGDPKPAAELPPTLTGERASEALRPPRRRPRPGPDEPSRRTRHRSRL